MEFAGCELSFTAANVSQDETYEVDAVAASARLIALFTALEMLLAITEVALLLLDATLVATILEAAVLEGATELLAIALPQTLPVTTGFSATPPFLLTWKPKFTDCPG